MLQLDKANVLITGIARDCERDLGKSISSLAKSFAAAKSISFLVVESDSSDKTVLELDKLSRNVSDFKYLSLGNLKPIYPKRTERISYCRNIYLQSIKSDAAYSDIDYIVVADLDGVNSRINNFAVQTCWSTGIAWDVCCANQDGPYYDIWALRHATWMPCDCWDQCRFLYKNGASKYASVYTSVYSRMLFIDPSSHSIDVDSAFGGCAIYGREAFLAMSYVGINANREEMCEHIAAHQQIKKIGGRIVINPAFINAGVVRNSWYATRFGQMALRLRCLVPMPMEGIRSIGN